MAWLGGWGARRRRQGLGLLYLLPAGARNLSFDIRPLQGLENFGLSHPPLAGARYGKVHFGIYPLNI